MKKITALLLALLMLFVFAACGETDKDDDDDKKKDDETIETTLAEGTEDVTSDSGTYEPEVVPPLSSDDPVIDEPVIDEPVVETPSTDAQKVASYISLHEQELIDTFESAFTGSGMTCSTTLETEGTGFILTVKINELENLTADQKATLQSTYDAAAATFEASLTTMQMDLPELTYFKVLVCEKDGDLIATISAG